MGSSEFRCAEGILLRLAATGFALATAFACWHGHTPLFGALFVGADWSEGSTMGVLRGVAAVMVAAVLLLWVRPCGGAAPAVRAGAVAVAVAALAVCAAAVEQAQLDRWSRPWAQAVRWLAPLVLAGWPATAGHRLPGWYPWGRRLLVLACAATFAGHGIAAWNLRGEYLDYLFTGGRWVDFALDEATARTVLRGIAVHDCALAVLLVVCGWCRGRGLHLAAAVASWMAVWGLATAAMRVGHGGFYMWPDAVVRLPNGLVPATVALWCWRDAAERRLARRSA